MSSGSARASASGSCCSMLGCPAIRRMARPAALPGIAPASSVSVISLPATTRSRHPLSQQPGIRPDPDLRVRPELFRGLPATPADRLVTICECHASLEIAVHQPTSRCARPAAAIAAQRPSQPEPRNSWRKARCTARKTRMIGNVVSTLPAIRIGQFVLSSCWSARNPRGRVIFAVDWM